MAKYSISYTRPGESPAIHELEADSDAAARIRFLNLSWVAFTDISINSIGIASAQPEAEKVSAKSVTAGVKPHPYRTAHGAGPCRECGQPADSKLHKGQGAIKNDPEPTIQPTRKGADLGKGEAAAIRANAAGLSPVQAAYHALALSSDSVPPRAEQLGKPKQNAKALRAVAAGIDWTLEANRLTEEIGDLADKAQALTRTGDYDAADLLREKAKTLAAKRAEITKRNRK